MGGNNNPEADGQFLNAPIFNFNDGKLKLDTNKVSNPNDNYGSVSGFSVSKSLFIVKRPYNGALSVSC